LVHRWAAAGRPFAGRAVRSLGNLPGSWRGVQVPKRKSNSAIRWPMSGIGSTAPATSRAARARWKLRC
jgi:hypothetical protein